MSYQVTPKGDGSINFATGSRSTKARTSQHYVKGRFIEQATKGEKKPSNNTTLEHAQMLKNGFSPRRKVENVSVDEATQLLFLSSPSSPNARGNSHRMTSPTNHSSRPGAHSSYNNRGQKQSKHSKAHNSSLGFKQTANQGMTTAGSINSTSAGNNTTLKIQNMRIYNETSSGLP